MDNIQKDVDVFLRNPSNFEDKIIINSTLYLLRRDISICFGINPNNHQKVDFQALFPATMGVMAGIDLMAKFVYNDKPNKVSERFSKYIKRYIDTKFSEEIYQLRNSLLHSFGLFSKDNAGKVYRFNLSIGYGELVHVQNKFYHIDIELLWNKFDKSIECYQEDLNKSKDLQIKFSEMYPKYGTICIK